MPTAAKKYSDNESNRLADVTTYFVSFAPPATYRGHAGSRKLEWLGSDKSRASSALLPLLLPACVFLLTGELQQVLTKFFFDVGCEFSRNRVTAGVHRVPPSVAKLTPTSLSAYLGRDRARSSTLFCPQRHDRAFSKGVVPAWQPPSRGSRNTK